MRPAKTPTAPTPKAKLHFKRSARTLFDILFSGRTALDALFDELQKISGLGLPEFGFQPFVKLVKRHYIPVRENLSHIALKL